MFTDDVATFVQYAKELRSDFGPPTAKTLFLVSPDNFTRATESASDNTYMSEASAYDATAAQRAHLQLQSDLSEHVPTICFAGRSNTPDALFPNNVFATSHDRLIVGHMLHPVRQKEAERHDIRQFFQVTLGYQEHDLSQQPEACELTGALVIDRARGIGWCGLSSRCSKEGARLMHEAFGLRATLFFELNKGEYHTNVVLAILAGRAAIVCPNGITNSEVVSALDALYPHVVHCTPEEHAAFVGNSISVSPDTVWMSQHAADTLRTSEKQRLTEAGFALKSVDLAAIEVAGGSLRCCIGEIY